MKSNTFLGLMKDIKTGLSAQRAARGHSTSAKSICLSGIVLLFLLAQPAFGQDPQASTGVTRLKITSTVLGEDRVVLVRTPQGYETNAQRYPVIYMTDGDSHIAHTSSTVEFLARNDRLPEMIVVAILNTDRTRDLTPTKWLATRPDGKTLQFPTSGGADKFLKFIETELMPRIESQYRTQPFKIFAGHSLGGLLAIHAMLSRPELFNSYIAVSPSLQWDDQAVVKRAEEFFKERKEFNKTLYVSLGNEKGAIAQGFNQFKELLSKSSIKGFEWDAQQMLDEDHGTVVLRSHYFGLRKIFNGWQIARDPLTGVVVGGLAGAEEHYKKLSQRLGYQIPVPEVLINQMGYQLLNNQKTDEAIAVFKSNVERYPASANVYDSLAEAYERKGQLDLARPNYEKAYTLGKQNNDPNVEVFKANFERVDAKLKQSPAAMKKQ